MINQIASQRARAEALLRDSPDASARAAIGNARLNLCEAEFWLSRDGRELSHLVLRCAAAVIELAASRLDVVAERISRDESMLSAG